MQDRENDAQLSYEPPHREGAGSNYSTMSSRNVRELKPVQRDALAEAFRRSATILYQAGTF